MYKNCEILEPEEKELANAVVMLLSDSEKRIYYRKKNMERSKDMDINSIVEKWIEVITE